MIRLKYPSIFFTSVSVPPTMRELLFTPHLNAEQIKRNLENNQKQMKETFCTYINTRYNLEC